MPDQGQVYRFRDHVVAGVNWRPTRFVGEVPRSRVCCICRMIVKRIVLLPCDHCLCQSCYSVISEGAGGRCPLDQEPFDEEECSRYNLPTRKASTLKVYCWNEDRGCVYEGTIEDMLRHYENECAFHSVECQRCGIRALHKELVTHYASGCTASASSARKENESSASTAPTLPDLRNALRNVETLLREANHEQLLLEIQGKINELTEQVRNQEHRLGEIAGEVAASVKAGMAQAAAPISGTALQARSNPVDVVMRSAAHMSRYQYRFADRPQGAVEGRRPRHILQFYDPKTGLPCPPPDSTT
ncbi:hypothetical protein MTO96_036889 [Rhipicephalus appendiculatus]